MSINVYLVFFHNANPTTFRKYAWIYCLVCFGGPAIPAVTLIAIHNKSRGLVYGDAAVSFSCTKTLERNDELMLLQLWCWIRADWGLLQLYSYYIPIWVCIFLSIIIYMAVGYRVFHHRNRLRNMIFSSSNQHSRTVRTRRNTSDAADSAQEVSIYN
jgi:hypothetical protein